MGERFGPEQIEGGLAISRDEKEQVGGREVGDRGLLDIAVEGQADVGSECSSQGRADPFRHRQWGRALHMGSERSGSQREVPTRWWGREKWQPGARAQAGRRPRIQCWI